MKPGTNHEQGTNHERITHNVNESRTSPHIHKLEWKLFCKPLKTHDSFFTQTGNRVYIDLIESETRRNTERETAMRMSIHDVVSVEIEETANLKTCFTRTLIIRDADGRKYEVTLFAKEEEALKVKI